MRVTVPAFQDAPPRGLRVGVSSVLAVLLVVLAILPASVWWSTLGQLNPSAQLERGLGLTRVMLAVTAALVFLGARAGCWRATDAPSPSVWRDPVLWALIAVALPLRLYRLGGGLWIDEITTLTDYVRHPVGYVITTYESNNQHILFSLLSRISVVILGESEAALRLPAALFGVASIGAVYALGKEVAGRRDGALTAALFVASYQHIWFSQNARGYSGLLCMATVSTLFLVRAMRRNDGRAWAGYAITTALGMYTHLTMIFVVMGQLAAWLAGFRGRGDRSRLGPEFVGGFVLSGVLTLLLYAMVLPQIPGASANDLSDVGTWRSPVWLMKELATGLRLGPAGAAIGLVGLLVTAVGVVDYWKRERAMVLVTVVSVAAGGLTMWGLGHHLWPRFFIYAGGTGLLLVVRGGLRCGELAARWVRWPAARGELLATVAFGLAATGSAASLRYVYGPKQDFASAVSFINSARRADDAVVSAGVATVALQHLYAPEWPVANTLAELDRVAASAPRAWLVYTLPIEMQANHADMLQRINASWVHQRTFPGTLGGGAIEVYLHERAAGATGVR